jgi:glucokinase
MTRPPIRVGLDIGGTKVLAVAVDGAGGVLAGVRLASESGPDRVVRVATTAVTELALRLGVERSALGGVGVGVPGLVDAANGMLSHAVNLGVGSDGLALAERLQASTGLPVSVENDVNAAAFGAYRGMALDGRDIAYLSIGTGLAAGLVLDGRLRRGARGTAGEIGHVSIEPEGPLCGCGQRGCLEALVSGSAIARAWPGTAAALFRAASAGDVTAARVRRQVARHLAVAVRLLVLTVDVDVVVLGGGVAELGQPLREAVSGALRRQAEGSAFLASLDLSARVDVVPAGRPVAAIGAALLAPDQGRQ